MIILCIIPARSGSKGISNKNIKLFNGKPLLAWSILQALESKYSMKIIVSTDSKDYKYIAESFGAEVPFLRPSYISDDLSTDHEFMVHCLEFLKEHQKYVPDIILHLRPTQPCRKVTDIDKCLDLFIQNYKEFDSLRTVVETNKSPYKMYNIQNNKLIPLFQTIDSLIEPYNQARQLLPTSYLHNGYIDITKASTVLNLNSVSGDKILPYIMNQSDTIDIDTYDDWENDKQVL